MRNDQTVQEKLRVETKIASVWIATAWLVRRFKRNWDQNRKRMNFQQPDWSKGTRKTNHIRHLAKEDQNEWMTHKQKEKKTISRIFLIFKKMWNQWKSFVDIIWLWENHCRVLLPEAGSESRKKSTVKVFMFFCICGIYGIGYTQNVWIWPFRYYA